MRGTLLLLILVLIGCEATPGVTARGNRIDPRTVAIRNQTGQTISVLTMRSGGGDVSEPIRIGQLTSIPPGATPSIARSETAPPMPDAVLVTATLRSGKRIEQTVALAPYAEDLAAGANTLVFIIRADGTISILPMIGVP